MLIILMAIEREKLWVKKCGVDRTKDIIEKDSLNVQEFRFKVKTDYYKLFFKSEKLIF